LLSRFAQPVHHLDRSTCGDLSTARKKTRKAVTCSANKGWTLPP
jgi:hypothetical protein